MKIICLIDNQTSNPELKSEHGLSYYIETENRKILFDLGQSPLFIDNAIKMGLDLSKVDTVVISHGHYDHAGGLKAFLSINKQAKIFIHKHAFRRHYSLTIEGDLSEIGIDSNLKNHPQVVLTDSGYAVGTDIILFSEPHQKKFYPSGNQLLKEAVGDAIFLDDFSHEQSMILIEGNQYVLFAGCAHKGILNIVNQAIEIMHFEPSHVLGGFHLHSRSTGQSERDDFILALGTELVAINTIYHTGHCTGIYAFQLLNRHYGQQMQYFSAGQTIKI